MDLLEWLSTPAKYTVVSKQNVAMKLNLTEIVFSYPTREKSLSAYFLTHRDFYFKCQDRTRDELASRELVSREGATTKT